MASFVPILPKRSGVGNMGIGAHIFKFDLILCGGEGCESSLPGTMGTTSLKSAK